MQYININQYTGALPVERQFECAHCGKDVWISEPSDRRYKFCSKECEKHYWRDLSKRRRCTNLRTFSEGQMRAKLAREQAEQR